jgi:uncharacterized membrane protein
MEMVRKLWLVVPRPIRQFPGDLAGVLLFIALTWFVLRPEPRGTPLQVLLGVPFVLFAPGYSFVSALFPRSGGTRDADENDRFLGPEGGLTGLERFLLSIGTSVVTVSLVALFINFVWEIRIFSILLL